MFQDLAQLNVSHIHSVTWADHLEAPDVTMSALFAYSNSKASFIFRV